MVSGRQGHDGSAASLAVLKETHLVLHQSWLVHRLNKPFDKPKGAIPCVIKNGTIDLNVMKEARPGLWEWDYMGSSEFEWGAVPKALKEFAAQPDLTSFVVKVPITDIRRPCGTKVGVTDPDDKITFYAIGAAAKKDEISERIRELAAHKCHLKEGTRIDHAVFETLLDKRTRGWFEMDNHFFFFMDKDMFHDARNLFGVISYFP